jgi:hypothetical protein
MQNIVELSPTSILTLAERLTHADAEGRRVRICTGTDAHGTWIKWAIGGEPWTPPFYGD